MEGNLLISGVRKPLGVPFATTDQGLQELHGATKELLPQAQMGSVIRSFGAVRPNPYVENGESLHDFCIENPAPGFYSLIGIKPPGLTCADSLGAYVAQKLAAELGAEANPLFRPHRKAIRRMRDLSAAERAAAVAEEPDYGEVVCLCEDVTKGEIREAIRRGANSVDGVKRRTSCTMGRCQGGRCTQRIEELLEQYLER